MATDVLAAGGVRTDAGRRRVAELDLALRDKRNLANPGTSADLTAAALFAAPPLTQDPAYHAFADQRGFLGIANFADVASNLLFVVAGLWGLFVAARPSTSAAGPPFASTAERLPYLVFFQPQRHLRKLC